MYKILYYIVRALRIYILYVYIYNIYICIYFSDPTVRNFPGVVYTVRIRIVKHYHFPLLTVLLRLVMSGPRDTRIEY